MHMHMHMHMYMCMYHKTHRRNTQIIYLTRCSTSAYRSAAGRWPQADHSRPERLASASLLRHSLAVAETPPSSSPALCPLPLLPPQISLLCSSGAGVASGAQYNGASTARAWLESCAHREESSLVLRAGPDQLGIEAAARASRAVGLELGDGAEPGVDSLADGCGLGKVLVMRATFCPRVGRSIHRG